MLWLTLFPSSPKFEANGTAVLLASPSSIRSSFYFAHINMQVRLRAPPRPRSLHNAGKWTAQLTVPGRHAVYIGTFANEVAAARAYDRAARQHGLLEKMNFPLEAGASRQEGCVLGQELRGAAGVALSGRGSGRPASSGGQGGGGDVPISV